MSHSTGKRGAHTRNYLRGPVSGNHSDDDPTPTLQYLLPPNIPTISTPIAAMLIAVVLNRDFHVLPAHIQIRDRSAKLVANGNLRLRPSKTGLHQNQP